MQCDILKSDQYPPLPPSTAPCLLKLLIEGVAGKETLADTAYKLGLSYAVLKLGSVMNVTQLL